MKKYLKWIILIIVALIIGLIIYSFSQNTTTYEEFVDYTPAEEISDEQLNRTYISLYYIESSTGNIVKEDRLIDSKLLLSSPEKTLLEELSKGSSFDTNISPIPENTVINNMTLDKNIVTIDFSKEFLVTSLESQEDEQKNINCIVNTLTQLNEVSGIKILIDGQENVTSNSGINLSNVFLRNN